jgi:hypothetical protein
VIDPTHNLYTFKQTYYDCNPTAPGNAFNGLTTHGVATINTGSSGSTLNYIGAWGAATVAGSNGGVSFVGR